MYSYNIWIDNSPKKFKDACATIEKEFPDVEKKKMLVDVDGTTIQTYTHKGKDIDVFDDYEVGAVFVKSEIKLDNIFN